MAIVRTSALRPVLAAVLLLVLMLSGVGRSLALADVAAQPGIGLPGITVPICHSGAGDPSRPVVPSRHDCCDECAFCAVAALPAGAPWVAPVRVAHVALHAAAMVWAPAVARVRTPRLSQGPPAA